MSGIEQLHSQNHALWRRVQHLVALKWSWEAIVDDVGLVGPRAVQDLCDWILEYKGPPKKVLPTVTVRTVLEVPVQSRLYSPSSQRFLAWRRQHEGARKAREASGL